MTELLEQLVDDGSTNNVVCRKVRCTTSYVLKVDSIPFVLVMICRKTKVVQGDSSMGRLTTGWKANYQEALNFFWV